MFHSAYEYHTELFCQWNGKTINPVSLQDTNSGKEVKVPKVMVSLPPAIARHERAGRSLRAVDSTSRKPLILYDWQNSLTLAQTDHHYALPKRQVLNDACVISIYVRVAPGRALAHFKL